MNKTATVRARIDPETKRKAEVILKRLGLTHSALITMTYRAVAETGGIPFSLHMPNAETQEELRRVRNPEERKRLPAFDSVEDLMADLENDPS